VLGYGLDERGSIGFDTQWRLEIFLFTIVSRMALGPTPASSYPMGTRSFFLGGKADGT
jgi:hypothetical protein